MSVPAPSPPIIEYVAAPAPAPSQGLNALDVVAALTATVVVAAVGTLIVKYVIAWDENKPTKPGDQPGAPAIVLLFDPTNPEHDIIGGSSSWTAKVTGDVTSVGLTCTWYICKASDLEAGSPAWWPVQDDDSWPPPVVGTSTDAVPVTIDPTGPRDGLNTITKNYYAKVQALNPDNTVHAESAPQPFIYAF